MATLRGFDRKFYFSYIHSQDTWGTKEADANLFPFRVNSDPFTITPEFVDDTDLIGGYEEASSQQELSRGVSGTLSQNKTVAPFLASMLAYTFGQSTDSTVDTSAGRHLISPVTATFPQKTFTALDLFSTAVYTVYNNCAVESLELSCSRKGWLATTANIVGSGNTATSGVTVGSLGAAPTMGPALKCGDLKIFRTVDGGTSLPASYTQGSEDLPGSASDISTTVRSFNWRINNNLYSDDAYEPGTGVYRGRAERERRAQTLSFTVEMADQAHLGYLTAQNTLALEFDFTTATLAGAATIYFGATIRFPKVLLTQRTITGGSGTLLVNCDAKIFNDGTNPTCHCTVWDQNTTGLLQA